MLTTLIHDVFATRMVDDVEETYPVQEDVESPFYIDEIEIKAVTPHYNEKGKRYKDRLVIVTQTDNYIIKDSFDRVVGIIGNHNIKRIGFNQKK